MRRSVGYPGACYRRRARLHRKTKAREAKETLPDEHWTALRLPDGASRSSPAFFWRWGPSRAERSYLRGHGAVGEPGGVFAIAQLCRSGKAPLLWEPRPSLDELPGSLPFKVFRPARASGCVCLR